MVYLYANGHFNFWVNHPDDLQEQRNRTRFLSVVPISAGIGTGFFIKYKWLHNGSGIDARVHCHCLQNSLPPSPFVHIPKARRKQSALTNHNKEVSSMYMYTYRQEYIPYPRERGPTTEYRPTPHFRLSFLLRSNVYSNMCPCVAALEKGSSNGWFEY